MQEIYNISSERAKQLEELSELKLFFSLINKEEKYVEKGENIEKYEELLNCLASALGIEKKTNERIKQVH